MLVVMEGTLTTSFPTMTFFPKLEEVPLVGEATWDSDFPIVMEGTREIQTYGIL